MILAGDIGGTNTRLALFTEAAARDGGSPDDAATYVSAEHDGLRTMVERFLAERPADIQRACFGVAGPVRHGRCVATNLAWSVDARELATALDLPSVALINDLEANGYGIAVLGPDDFESLNEGDPDASGNVAMISAGTGLGEAGLYWDGRRHRPFASEGGHADFAPRTAQEEALREFLAAEHGHVSYERVCSGMGLANIHRFLGGSDVEPGAISAAALAGTDERAVKALDLMVSIYGAEAGNLALKIMATGGVYLGGGIAPRILPKLRDGTFMRTFTAKGRFSALLQGIPVQVILNDKAALLGAAHCAVSPLGAEPDQHAAPLAPSGGGGTRG
jgi:glucokinase